MLTGSAGLSLRISSPGTKGIECGQRSIISSDISCKAKQDVDGGFFASLK